MKQRGDSINPTALNTGKGDNDEPDIGAVADNIDPTIGTPVLDLMAKSDIVGRGEIRQNIIDRVRVNIKQRRTKDAISKRISNSAITPFTNAVEVELSNRIRENIKSNIDQRRSE